jgi:hypothetical protein
MSEYLLGALKESIPSSDAAAAVNWLMDFYPCAWGHETKGISRVEAKAVVEGILRQLVAAESVPVRDANSQ